MSFSRDNWFRFLGVHLIMAVAVTLFIAWLYGPPGDATALLLINVCIQVGIFLLFHGEPDDGGRS